MSWAAHDPEGWTEVCLQGILVKMETRHIRTLTQPDPEIDRRVLEELGSGLDSYNVFAALMDWASDEIAQAEADYHTGGCLNVDSTPILMKLDQFTFVAHWCQQSADSLTCGLAILQVDPFQIYPMFLGWLL